MSIYHEPGDTNQDGSLDARDVSLLKQYLLANGDLQSYAENLDVNLDGKFDKQDVKALIRLLTGKPESEDEEPQQTDVTGYPIYPETTTTVTTICPLYGRRLHGSNYNGMKPSAVRLMYRCRTAGVSDCSFNGKGSESG